MILNRDQIVARGVITENFSRQSLRDASYDLRIDTLFGRGEDGRSEKRKDDYDLRPQGVAAAVSKEIVSLPADICAFASVRTSLCREGVLAINIGLIDPGWHGPISSLLLNFGKSSYRLKESETFLRLTFHTMELPVGGVTSVKVDPGSYTVDIEQKFERRLSETFMDLHKATEKASKQFTDDLRNSIFKWVALGGFILAFFAFLLNFGALTLAGLVP